MPAKRQRSGGEPATEAAPLGAPQAPLAVLPHDALYGEVFVFTGFRDPRLASLITRAGGAYRDSLSRAVTTVLAKDAATLSTGKMRAAAQRGLRTLTRAEFEAAPLSRSGELEGVAVAAGARYSGDPPSASTATAAAAPAARALALLHSSPASLGIRLRATSEDAAAARSLGASRVGGIPDAPPALAWPSALGEPMQFVAQVDLRDAAAAAPLPGVGASDATASRALLPRAGWLLFFRARDYWGEGSLASVPLTPAAEAHSSEGRSGGSSGSRGGRRVTAEDYRWDVDEGGWRDVDGAAAAHTLARAPHRRGRAPAAALGGTAKAASRGAADEAAAAAAAAAATAASELRWRRLKVPASGVQPAPSAVMFVAPQATLTPRASPAPAPRQQHLHGSAAAAVTAGSDAAVPLKSRVAPRKRQRATGGGDGAPTGVADAAAPRHDATSADSPPRGTVESGTVTVSATQVTDDSRVVAQLLGVLPVTSQPTTCASPGTNAAGGSAMRDGDRLDAPAAATDAAARRAADATEGKGVSCWRLLLLVEGNCRGTSGHFAYMMTEADLRARDFQRHQLVWLPPTSNVVFGS